MILGAFNFPFSEMDATHETYIAYLEKLALCSDRNIKNRQFHAIISTKEREHDKDFLNDIAQKWMKKMGYGEQPYIVYFHGDTANNHVHIVSSRITMEGKRIDPYMEGRRAGLFINELMNENLKEKASFDIKDALFNYSFSTVAQFRLILERRGWTTREKEGNINLVKIIRQGSVSKEDVIAKSQQYNRNEQRIRQLRAIFKKYSSLPNEQFIKVMRDNFGIEVIFHTARGNTKPYGYTVIDHNIKVVMKGGEILPLDALLSKKSREEHQLLANEIVINTLSRNNSYSALRMALYRSGYAIKKNNVFQMGDDMPLLQIDREAYKNALYNDRLKEANKFIVRTKEEAYVISRYLYLKERDIKISPEIARDDTAYREMVNSFENKAYLKAYLKENKQALITCNHHTLLIDMRHHVIANVSGLGLEDVSADITPHYERNKDTIDDFMAELTGVQSVLFAFLGLFETQFPEEQDYTKKKRRKKQMKL